MQDTYRSVVQKWGDSLVIRLTNECIRSLNIQERDVVRYAVEATGQTRQKRHKIPESWKKNNSALVEPIEPITETPDVQPLTAESPTQPTVLDRDVKRSILHLLKFKPVEEVLLRATTDTEYTTEEILADLDIAEAVKKENAPTSP